MAETNSTLEIIKIGTGVISGGAFGAIITAIINKRNNRIQRISKNVKISNIFYPNELLYPHITRITISGTTEDYHFENLYLCQIAVENKGNKDFNQFNFGISMPEASEMVNIQYKSSDRHHIATFDPAISFNHSSNVIDATLTPFNRKNIYHIDILFTSNRQLLETQIQFSTAMPVVFMDFELFRKTFSEIFKEMFRVAPLFPFS